MMNTVKHYKKEPSTSNHKQLLLSLSLTFDLNEHEFFIGHGTVVGALLRGIHTSQTHTAEVFLTGQPSKSNLRETAVLIHYERESERKRMRECNSMSFSISQSLTLH